MCTERVPYLLSPATASHPPKNLITACLFIGWSATGGEAFHQERQLYAYLYFKLTKFGVVINLSD